MQQNHIVARIERNYVSTETTENLLLSDVDKSTYEYTNAWKDQLSSYNGNDIHYDNLGNPTSIGSNITMEWEGRQLTKYTDTSQYLVVEYKYNDQGYRTEKKVTKNGQTITTNYFLDGDKVLRETRTDGVNIDYFYDIDGKLTGFSYNNNIYLYIRNIQGDITKIVDESGNVVVEYSYDAWGNIVNSKEYNADGTEKTELDIAKINPYRYRGYRYDEETSLYYLNSRYYNPDMGRFLNADGIIGETGDILSHNMYAYAKNNPVMMVDPSGYWPSWIKTALIIVAVVAVVAAVVILAPAVIPAIVSVATQGVSLGTTIGGVISAGTAITAGELLGIGVIASGAALVMEMSESSQTKTSSLENTKIKRPFDFHHIVPQGAIIGCEQCQYARDILDEVGIGVHGPQNIIILERGYHSHFHTLKYKNNVCDTIIAAYKLGGNSPIMQRLYVEGALMKLRAEILMSK